ncbi:MAG: hypothetical protein J6M47_10050 [Clostridia bacterium]|nr:hypothetical protein [Clostridia bacterium]
MKCLLFSAGMGGFSEPFQGDKGDFIAPDFRRARFTAYFPRAILEHGIGKTDKAA